LKIQNAGSKLKVERGQSVNRDWSLPCNENNIYENTLYTEKCVNLYFNADFSSCGNH
jgi:hypothetical protein